MVPTLVSGPGRLLVVDRDGCLSLEVTYEKREHAFVVKVRDHAFPGSQEPREACFYSVADRNLFTKALCDERLRTCAQAPASRWLFRPRVSFA